MTKSTASTQPGQIQASFTFTDKHLDALRWMVRGMSHYIRTYEFADGEERVAAIEADLARIAEAHAQADAQLPALVRALMDKVMVFRAQPIFVLMGFHGALVFEEGEFGYFEFDSPLMAKDKIVEVIHLALETGTAVNLEFELPSLKILCQRYPDLLPLIIEGMDKGVVELINTTYAHPYAHMIGPESNIRQFEYGGRLFRELFAREPQVYVCSEVALHPQTPQIVKYHGLRAIGMRARLMGVTPGAPHPLIAWEAPDGSRLPALAHHVNNFSGDYYASSFYKEFFNMLIQARSGSPKDYAVLSCIVDHTVEMEDNVAEAFRLTPFAPVLGRHVTYSQLFSDGPEPCGAFRFPADQFEYARIPAQRGDGLGRKIHLACARLERRLLQTERLVSRLLMEDKPVDYESALERAWTTLLHSQNHDAFTVPYYKKGQYHRERLHINPAVFKPYIDPIPEDGPSIGEATLNILKTEQERLEAFIQQTLQAAGLPIEAAGNSADANAALATNSAPWKITMDNGQLRLASADGLNLTLTALTEAGEELPLSSDNSQANAYCTDGMAISFDASQPQLKIRARTSINGLRLRFSGFAPGADFLYNLPMLIEPTWKRRFVTTAMAWVRDAFMLLSDANYYYSADLDHTWLANDFYEMGDYGLTLIRDGGGNGLAWAGAQLSLFQVPPTAWSVDEQARVRISGPVVESETIFLQAIVPGRERLTLRLMNYSPSEGLAKIFLPSGWRLGRQVDAAGRPCGLQPEADMVSLGPWAFGSFEIVRI